MIMIAICLAWYRALSKVPHSALIYNLQCNGDSFPSLVRIPPGLVEKFIEAFDNDDTLYASKLTIFNETVDNIKKLKTERRDSVDILVHADSLVNAATPGPEMEQVYKSIKEITHDKIEKVDILATNFDKSHLFISGIQTRHPKPCTISYHITDFTVSFSFSTSKAYSKALCFELRREVDRAIKELMILFPLRSEAWGPHWVFGKNMIDREVGILRVHRLLTDKYMEKVNLVKERFEKFRRPAEDDKEL